MGGGGASGPAAGASAADEGAAPVRWNTFHE